MRVLLRPFLGAVRMLRRRLRFSLATLLVVVTAISAVLGFVTQRQRNQRELVRRVKQLGGSVKYSWETGGVFRYSGVSDGGEGETVGRSLPGPDWLRDWLGIDYVDRLAEVRLVGAPLTDEDFDLLGAQTELRSLQLTATSTNDRRLLKLAPLHDLEQLELSDTQVGDEGLAAIEAMSGLRKLSLANTHIAGPGLKHIANMQKLEELEVSQTLVDDEAMNSLSGLAGLRRLFLSYTSVGDRGIERLTENVPNGALAELESIDLSHSQIGAAAAARLAQLPKLKRVDLAGAPLGNNGLIALVGSSSISLFNVGHARIDEAVLGELAPIQRPITIWLDYYDIPNAALDAFKMNHPNIEFVVLGGASEPRWQPRGADYARWLNEAPPPKSGEEAWERAYIADALDHSATHYKKDVDSLFLQAVQRSETPAAIYRTWALSRPKWHAAEQAKGVLEGIASARSDEKLWQSLIATDDPRLLCLGAAAAIDPHDPLPWIILAARPGPIREQVFAAWGRHASDDGLLWLTQAALLTQTAGLPREIDLHDRRLELVEKAFASPRFTDVGPSWQSIRGDQPSSPSAAEVAARYPGLREVPARYFSWHRLDGEPRHVSITVFAYVCSAEIYNAMKDKAASPKVRQLRRSTECVLKLANLGLQSSKPYRDFCHLQDTEWQLRSALEVVARRNKAAWIPNSIALIADRKERHITLQYELQARQQTATLGVDLYGEAMRYDQETDDWLRERMASLGLDQPIEIPELATLEFEPAELNTSGSGQLTSGPVNINSD